MMALDLLIICLMAIGLVVYVGEPLLRQAAARPPVRPGDDAAERLLMQKELLYGAIRDLDFDFHTGKVDQRDHAELRQQLESEAVQILRQLDALDPAIAFDQAVEAQVTVVRQRRLASVSDSGRGALCAHCRTSLENDEAFCPACGHASRHA